MRFQPSVLAFASVVALAVVTTAASMGATGVTTKVAYISDPTLSDVNAVAIKVPSRWRFEGWLTRGDSCGGAVPAPVFKAASPDGVTTVAQEPAMIWKWGSGPAFDGSPKKDCLQLEGRMSAQDFMKHYASSLGLTYVGPDQVPAAVLAEEKKANAEAAAQVAKERQRDVSADSAAGINLPNFHSDFHQTTARARAIVTSHKGTMKGRFDVTMFCTRIDTPSQPMLAPNPPARMIPGPSSTVSSCTATVVLLNTTAAKYAEVSRAFDSALLGHPEYTSAWRQAWMERLQTQTLRGMRNIAIMTQRDMQIHAQEFARDQQTRQAMHDQFMDSFNSNFQASQAVNNQNINARQTAASDWVDYAGDRQTVQDVTTGATYKISNQVPVGGNVVQVHGNGTPW
jgi:hypothetical protein